MTDPILFCNSLSFNYSNKSNILNDISFEVKQGEFISILGQNGSGKSTLIKLLSNRLQAKSGTIKFNDKSLSSYTTKEFASFCGYLEQSPSVTEISLFDYVLHGAMPLLGRNRFWFSNHEKERAKELIEEFELASLSGQIMTEVSGGERQLAQICRAMMANPKVILLDEPVSHLDIHHIDTVIQKLKELQKKKCITIISILHDVNLAFSVSDRIFLLNNSGNVEIVENMKTPSCEQFSTVFNTTFYLEENQETNRALLIPPYY